ncbi:MAG TPA: hypothetical protein VGM11_02225 [Acidobacteriaceae bacterium]
MSALVWAMVGAGLAALVAGLVLVRPRFRTAEGAGKLIVLGPVFEAVALAIFAAEHFLAARGMMGIVPKWLPGPLFWTYFFGVALAAAAISLIVWRSVGWSALLLALFFLLIVITIDLPNLHKELHDRFFWILTVRETCFASGAMVLAGHCLGQTPIPQIARAALVRVGRVIVAAAMVFYAIEHFLHPLHVPGVPLEKMTPAWVPGPAVLAYFVGLVLLAAGVAMFVPRMVRIAAAAAGAMLVLLVVFFYVPIFLTEMHTPLALEGMNYVGDTLLFGATVLLAGWDAESRVFRD